MISPKNGYNNLKTKGVYVMLFEYLNVYRKEHKLTTIITSFAVLILIVIFIVLRDDISYIEGKTDLSFIGNEELSFLNIITTYNGANKDTIKVGLKLNDNSHKNYTFMTSKNIELKKNSYFGGTVTKYLEDDEHVYYSINFKRKEKNIMIDFIGNVYGTNIYDKNLELTISSKKTIQDTKLVIFHQYINVDNIFPENATNESAYGKEYKIKKNSVYVLQGFDQKQLHQSQIRTFDLGIIIGILLSIITGVLIDFSFYYDRNRQR